MCHTKIFECVIGIQIQASWLYGNYYYHYYNTNWIIATGFDIISLTEGWYRQRDAVVTENHVICTTFSPEPASITAIQAHPKLSTPSAKWHTVASEVDPSWHLCIIHPFSTLACFSKVKLNSPPCHFLLERLTPASCLLFVLFHTSKTSVSCGTSDLSCHIAWVAIVSWSPEIMASLGHEA